MADAKREVRVEERLKIKIGMFPSRYHRLQCESSFLEVLETFMWYDSRREDGA